MESGVKFLACDNPGANELTIHILVAVAQAEAKAISERTKAALAAYKARGGRLSGQLAQCRSLTQRARQQGTQTYVETIGSEVAGFYASALEVIKAKRAEGKTLQEISEHSNESGYVTRRG